MKTLIMCLFGAISMAQAADLGAAAAVTQFGEEIGEAPEYQWLESCDLNADYKITHTPTELIVVRDPENTRGAHECNHCREAHFVFAKDIAGFSDAELDLMTEEEEEAEELASKNIVSFFVNMTKEDFGNCVELFREASATSVLVCWEFLI